jgi:hypothetical protein
MVGALPGVRIAFRRIADNTKSRLVDGDLDSLQVVGIV